MKRSVIRILLTNELQRNERVSWITTERTLIEGVRERGTLTKTQPSD